jgi:hypothetical protein
MGFVAFFIYFLFFLLGILFWGFYGGQRARRRQRGSFCEFAAERRIPGLMGVIVASIIAASMSSLGAAINCTRDRLDGGFLLPAVAAHATRRRSTALKISRDRSRCSGQIGDRHPGHSVFHQQGFRAADARAWSSAYFVGASLSHVRPWVFLQAHDRAGAPDWRRGRALGAVWLLTAATNAGRLAVVLPDRRRGQHWASRWWRAGCSDGRQSRVERVFGARPAAPLCCPKTAAGKGSWLFVPRAGQGRPGVLLAAALAFTVVFLAGFQAWV